MNGTPSVLLLEDNPSNALTLQVLLEDESFAVEHVASCASARARIESGGPCDLALLDLKLGDGLGTDLVPQLRRVWPQAVLVLLSGARETVDAPMDAVLEKGMPFVALVAELRTLLAQRAGK